MSRFSFLFFSSHPAKKEDARRKTKDEEMKKRMGGESSLIAKEEKEGRERKTTRTGTRTACLRYSEYLSEKCKSISTKRKNELDMIEILGNDLLRKGGRTGRIVCEVVWLVYVCEMENDVTLENRVE